jgi:hypothetical protein
LESFGNAGWSWGRTGKEHVAMNPSEEFLRHAADCAQMAKFTRDPASKITWSRMAERWLHCAEEFNRRSSVLQARQAEESAARRNGRERRRGAEAQQR